MQGLELRDSLTIYRYKFDNGLDVVLLPNNKAPVISVNIAYKVGSAHEKTDKTGMAHLFEHLMFEGSKNIMKGEFDRLCSLAGGTNNAYTTYDYTNYYMSLPSNQLKLGLWLEADRMMNFEVNKESLKNQKNVVIEEIKQTVEDLPYGLWRELLAKSSFLPQCSYSWEVHGSKKHVASVTLEEAEYFRKMYYQPNNACLVIAGDIEHNNAINEVEKFFAAIPKYTEELYIPTFNNSLKISEKHERFSENVPLPAVFFAFHSCGFKEDESFAIDMLSNILGNGRSSRLYQSLVENKQIASESGAFVDKREKSSLLTFYAIANSPSISCDMLYDEMMDVIQSITQNKITENELKKTRNQLTTQLAHELQSFASIADIIAQQTLFWDNPERLYGLLDTYSDISIEDILYSASKILANNKSIRIDAIIS